MSIQSLLILFTLGVSGIATLSAQPPMPTPAARQFNFPPIGLAFGETMQVNLFNQAGDSDNGAAASCTGNVSFLDANGKAIPKSGGTFAVGAGVTQSISLLGTAVDAGVGSRAEIRAVVSLNASHEAPCSLVQSLETFDTSTGATHVYLTGSTPKALPFPASIVPRD